MVVACVQAGSSSPGSMSAAASYDDDDDDDDYNTTRTWRLVSPQRHRVAIKA